MRRARTSPGRSRPGSASSCIGARWNGSGGNRGRRWRASVLANWGGRAGRLRGIARRCPVLRPDTVVAARGPVRPPRTRRADRLPGVGAGVHRAGAGRSAAPVEPARRPAAGRPGRRVRLPARSRLRAGDRHDDGGTGAMKAAIYARVSTDSQQQRGTIGSQLAVLRERLAAEGDELVAEFCDDGHSGARLDRPGLDSLRDAAEAGVIERIWCLSPERLARVYAYQVIVLDELARHRVQVAFADAPAIDDDPQSKLLTQVQGVIAEYERAKIAERYRRGKLFRSRAGVLAVWRVAHRCRRRCGGGAGACRGPSRR